MASFGDTRKKSGFLFFPKTIQGETRWLKYATWIEKYNEWVNGLGQRELDWHPYAWN